MLTYLQRLIKSWKNQKKYYQSPMQEILDQWDRNHPPSPSQSQEIQNNAEVHKKRDQKISPPKTSVNWLEQDDIQ